LLSGALILVLTAVSARDDQPQGVVVTTATVAERIPLPRTRAPLKVTVEAMAARILVMAAPQYRAAVLARLHQHAAWICPRIVERPAGVELRCRTRLLDAAMTVEGADRFLDIRELRGLPWRAGADGPPFFHFEPRKTGLGDPCPGDNPVARGECLLQTRPVLEAAKMFRVGLRTHERQLAALRLGDIALASGDPATAVAWYNHTGTLGVFGRVARTRLCELDGTCLGSTEALKTVFDPSGLPAPVRAEMSLRFIRAQVFHDRFASALTSLDELFQAERYETVCPDHIDRLCRRLLLEILRQKTIRDADADVQNDKSAAHKQARALSERAMALYLGLPRWDRGPYAVELALAAADTAERSGAPVFAGNILSAVGPMVAPADLADHLAHTAELFLRGGDETRARVVIEYATSSAPRQMQSPRWRAIVKALAAGPGKDDHKSEAAKIDAAMVTQEVAAALAVSGRARALIDKQPAPVAQGGRQ
jgi:hypothetical protein